MGTRCSPLPPPIAEFPAGRAADADADIRARIASRFAWFPTRCYVRSKLRTDPVYRAVWEELRPSPLPLLDLGCGPGLLAFYLREHGWQPPITGVDFDRQKVALARRAQAAARYPEVALHPGDVTRLGSLWPPPAAANVALLDVLHYLPAADQGILLTALARHLAPGARVLIRTTLRDTSWRYRATYAQELLMRATGWMRTECILFPTLAEVAAPFRTAGFEENIRPLWGRTPFNSSLLVFRRPPTADALISPVG